MLDFNLDTQKPTTDLTPMDLPVEVAGKLNSVPLFLLIKNCARKLMSVKKKTLIIDSALRDLILMRRFPSPHSSFARSEYKSQCAKM